MTEENKEMEWGTHALASQAAARANATPWLKELNPYMVRVILPHAETKAFLREADKNFVFLSSYRHNLSDFIIICRPLWRVKIERMGKPCIIIHNTDKKQLMGELDKVLKNKRVTDSITLCERSVSVDGGSMFLPLFVTSYSPYPTDILKTEAKLPRTSLAW